MLGSRSSRRSTTAATLDDGTDGTGGTEIQFRFREVPVGEVVLVDGVAVTSLAWTATSIAAELGSESDAATALMVLEGALNLGASKDDLLRCSVGASGKVRGPLLARWIEIAGGQV